VRRRIKTLEPSPEDIGLCGCWRIAAVERVTIDLTKPAAQQLPVTEIAYYVGSRTKDELNDADMKRLWSASAIAQYPACHGHGGVHHPRCHGTFENRCFGIGKRFEFPREPVGNSGRAA
jgi:hypothetical protein